MNPYGYLEVVHGLTKQERRVLTIIVVLLLTGWSAKMYRAAHPPGSPPGHGAARAGAVMPPARP